MAQQLLNRPQIGSPFEEMGGIRVAQRMRVNGALGGRVARPDT